MTRTRPARSPSFPGLRTSAVTACPRASASAVASRPTAPVAPSTSTRIPLPTPRDSRTSRRPTGALLQGTARVAGGTDAGELEQAGRPRDQTVKLGSPTRHRVDEEESAGADGFPCLLTQ